jgi:hypothetical protein
MVSYLANGDPGSVRIFRPGIYANTITKWDMITWCPDAIEAAMANAPSPVRKSDQTKAKQTKLDSFGGSLSRVMVHEFAHWYGADGAGTNTLTDTVGV